jgi:hypothetical protein
MLETEGYLYDRNTFIVLGPMLYNFYGRNLLFFKLSYRFFIIGSKSFHKDKRYSLIQNFVNYDLKKFYNIGHWPLYWKYFFPQNLRKKAFPPQSNIRLGWKSLPVARDKHSSLL